MVSPNVGVSQQPPDGTNQGGTTTNGVTPGISTRGGSSYVGVAGNIGLLGNAAISEGNVAVISKIGLNTARLTNVETLHVTSLQGFHALRFS